MKAWKRRVANGHLMKGAGGAALRHHPRLGRRGKDQLKLNRLGNIGGKPNPKRKKLKQVVQMMKDYSRVNDSNDANMERNNNVDSSLNNHNDACINDADMERNHSICNSHDELVDLPPCDNPSNNSSG